MIIYYTIKIIEYNVDVLPEVSTFDQNILKSNWSHRHFAKIAGIGTFGINNMLISKNGSSYTNTSGDCPNSIGS